MEAIKQTLIMHGIKPSYHRIRIYHYLLQEKNHPSADFIYQELVKEVPTLAKATVYNTLHVLADKGLIKILGIVDNEARFDAGIVWHGHFLCNSCGRIRDIPLKSDLIDLEDLADCLIEESHIYFKGCCSACRELNNPEAKHSQDQGDAPEGGAE